MFLRNSTKTMSFLDPYKMAMKRVYYDVGFADELQMFLELIKRNSVIRTEAMNHYNKNEDQLFSIAVRLMIMSYNRQHANDKPLTQTQLDDLAKQAEVKRK